MRGEFGRDTEIFIRDMEVRRREALRVASEADAKVHDLKLQVEMIHRAAREIREQMFKLDAMARHCEANGGGIEAESHRRDFEKLEIQTESHHAHADKKSLLAASLLKHAHSERRLAVNLAEEIGRSMAK